MSKRGRTAVRSKSATTFSKASSSMTCLADRPAVVEKPADTAATVPNLSGLRRVPKASMSTTHVMRATRRGYMELQPSDIRHIEDTAQSAQPVIRPMGGSRTAGFSIGMAGQMLALLDLVWENEFVVDDRKFHEVLRLFASIHYFIGGDGYSRSLSEVLGLSISTVNRWLNGQSAPIPTVRLLAYQESDRLVRRIIEERKLGTEISDYQRNETVQNKRGG